MVNKVAATASFQTTTIDGKRVKKVVDKKVISQALNRTVDDLKNEDIFIKDTNNNGKYDEGEELYKQITVMVDAGHGQQMYLKKGQKIILSNDDNTIKNSDEYIVQPGDNLDKIARKTGHSKEAILACNTQITNPNIIKIGDKLSLPNSSSTYITKDKDTLESISWKFGKEKQVLKDLNSNLEYVYSKNDHGAPPTKEYIDDEKLKKVDIENRPHEDYFTLMSAIALSAELIRKGYKVKFTSRQTPNERYQQKMHSKPDLFISLHCNAAKSSEAKGESVHIDSRNTNPMTKKLAKNVNATLAADDTFSNRGIVDQHLAVCLGDIPSVLVEVAFMSNTEDYVKLFNGKYVEQVNAIAKGINNFVEEYKIQDNTVAEDDNKPDETIAKK